MHTVWVEDRAWRLPPPGHGKRCRNPRCRRPAVAEFFRRGRRRASWWAYCGEHLYGRRFAAGKVWIEVLADSESAALGYFQLSV